MLSAAKHLRNTLEGEALPFVQGDKSIRERDSAAPTPDLVILL